MSRDRIAEPLPPLYARLLRLRHVAPSGFVCFIFLEGAVALGILLALAELVSWWGVLVLPASVAAMVKLNDVVAGVLTAPPPPVVRPPAVPFPKQAPQPPPAHLVGETTTIMPGVMNRAHVRPVLRSWAEPIDAQQQRVRQSASRRYE
jgi:hypothetical protein